MRPPLLLPTLLACALALAQPVARISIDPSQRFQTIDGFGVNFNGTYFRESQKPMIDLLVKDLGATIFRLDPYGLSDWEAKNDDDDPAHMNWEYYNDRYSTGYFEASWGAARYLNSLGIRPFLTLSGITPEWMNDNAPAPPSHRPCVADEKIRAGGYRQPYHLNPAMYDEFAEMAASMLLYARWKAHVDFEYFSPFNETDCYPREGPRIDPDEMPKALEALLRRLKRERLDDVKLVVADQANSENNYADPILRNDGVMKQCDVLSLHSYHDRTGNVARHFDRIRASKHPRMRIWLTEYGDLGVFDRSSEAEWKRQCLTATRRVLRALNEGAQAALFWDAFDNYHEHDKAIYYHGLLRYDDHRFAPKKRYYAAKQLYRFVPPGAERIAAAAEAPGLLVSAFRTADEIVIVGVKEGGPSRLHVALTQAGAGPAAWDLYLTTRQLDCRKTASIAADAVIELPDEAIFTMVGKETK
jgi:O-glycosyl hydrolase